MLFHTFATGEERRKFGGSEFIEIQFCRLPQNTEIKNIVSVSGISHWQNDSLYVHDDDQNLFLKEYKRIFDCGIYNNSETGTVDPFGINYYRPEQIGGMIGKLSEIKPEDWERLAEWLNSAKKYNGFYILGI